MATVAHQLTLEEFEEKYAKSDVAYEYWCGRAIPKSLPTWIHGLLQIIIGELLASAGLLPASEVELRIVSQARPKPDVIATRGLIDETYPTKAVDVVIEILSADDSMSYLIEKCRAYREWGFAEIYLVDPLSRLVFRWTGQALEISDTFATIPTAKIWERLDQRVKLKAQQ